MMMQKKGGCWGLFNLRENSKASILEGLNVTSQVAAHRKTLLRYEFKHSAANTGLLTIMKRLVSSANSRVFEPISLTKSLM